MKIVSYNVNGLRSRLASPQRTLSTFLDSLDADIICLQETKMARHELTADVAVAEGYESFFSCTRTFKKGRIGYSGVATFCRVGSVPSSTSPVLPVAADEGFTGLLHRSQNGEIEGDKGRVGCYEQVAKTALSMQELLQLDSEGRCIITDHGSFVLFNLYCPRVECGDIDRLEFKLNFFRVLQCRWEALLGQNRRVIAVGDFNVSPYAIDSCAPGPDFDKNECRKWLRSLLKDEGGAFWDVFRFFHRHRKEAYTCWSQSSGAEEFNYGTRIDLILAAGRCNHAITRNDAFSHGFVECEVQDSDILSEFRRVKPDTHPRWQGGRSLKLEGSDHAPIVMQLREQSPVELHEVPPLAARFMPEIRGRQQNLFALLKRQQSLTGLQDTESKMKVSRLELVTRATGPTMSMATYVERGSEFGTSNSQLPSNMRKLSPSNKVGNVCKSTKVHSSATVARKPGVRLDQKYDSQQKDLHAFFVSSSVKTKSLFAREKIRTSDRGSDVTDADTGTEHSFAENVDALDVNRNGYMSKSTYGDFDLMRSQGSIQITNAFTNERKEQCQTQNQTLSGCRRPNQSDAECFIQFEQVKAVEGTKTLNAVSAWMRIKAKMAQAVPLCQGHNEPCVARVVKKPGPNIGRGFYVCARAEGPVSNPEARCDHFEWASSFKKGVK